MNKIIICRASEMTEKLQSESAVAVLTIEHPGVSGSDQAPRLAGTPQKILTFWDSEDKAVREGPDIEQVEAGLAFVMEHVSKGPVIIHCHAGKARSAGLALGVLSLLHPHDSEKQLIDRLLAIRPAAAPNIIVVEMVDQLTGRGGKLLQAVLDDPRLSAARAETEESRRRWVERDPERAKKLYPEKFPQPPQP